MESLRGWQRGLFRDWKGGDKKIQSLRPLRSLR